MRLEFLLSWVLFISILLTATCVHAQDLPSRTEILADLRLVQDHWIAANADPGNRGWARAEYVTTFQEMAAALTASQRADGFWNVNLADTTDFGVGAYLLAGSEMFLLASGASEVPIAEQPNLAQNVPNPFNPVTAGVSPAVPTSIDSMDLDSATREV